MSLAELYDTLTMINGLNANEAGESLDPAAEVLADLKRKAEGKTVYVIQLEMGYDIENWASYMFDGIEAPFGAYGMTILLMVNVD